jgi:hypothetical protein
MVCLYLLQDRDSMLHWYNINHPTNTSHTHTMKPSDLLLLAHGTLQSRMYHAGKVDISRHLAIPGFPQSNHTVGNSVQTLVHCVEKHSRPPDLKLTSNVSLPFAWITGPATDPSCRSSKSTGKETGKTYLVYT